MSEQDVADGENARDDGDVEPERIGAPHRARPISVRAAPGDERGRQHDAAEHGDGGRDADLRQVPGDECGHRDEPEPAHAGHADARYVDRIGVDRIRLHRRTSADGSIRRERLTSHSAARPAATRAVRETTNVASVYRPLVRPLNARRAPSAIGNPITNMCTSRPETSTTVA